jgi:hypothetical protein
MWPLPKKAAMEAAMGVAMGVATEVVALALLSGVEAAGEAQVPPSASHQRETWAAIRDLWAATARGSECTRPGWAREPFNTNTGQHGNTALAPEPFNTNTGEHGNTAVAPEPFNTNSEERGSPA